MIEAEFQHSLERLASPKRCFVGLSGGLDSVVLLHLAYEYAIRRGIELYAIHIHHGLSPNADTWQRHCHEVALDLNVPLLTERVDVSMSGSLEASARTARYQAFKARLEPGDILLLGHHQDDQIETVLMRLMRSGHSSMLSAIPDERMMDDVRVVRPLLNVSRQEILDYAKGRGLKWVEDESNHDIQHERNRLRHEVLPRLERKAPDIRARLLSVCQKHQAVNACAARLINALCTQPIFVSVYGGECGLSLAALAQLTETAQRNLVRGWLASLGVAQPSETIFERIWSELIPARVDARPQLVWSGMVAERYENALFCYPRAINEKSADIPEDTILWAELPSKVKLFSRSKKDWQKRLKLPPWRRKSLAIEVSDDEYRRVYFLENGQQVLPESD